MMTSPVTLADLNSFTILHAEVIGDRSVLSGRLSQPGQPSPGEQVSLFISLDDEDLVGELVEVNADAGTAVLSLYAGHSHPAVMTGAALPVYDNYWSGRIGLVLDTRIQWTRKVFGSPDAFEQVMPNGVRSWREVQPGDEARTDGKIVPGGWDHEHCELCWTHIGAGGDPEGWVTDADQWVCVACHARFVEPRDLRFLIDGPADGSADPPTPDEQAFHDLGLLIDAYDLDAIRSWLDAGNKADVRNRNGWTPLMVAASRDQRSLVDLLLAAGADPSAVADAHGYTPLALAAQKGYAEVTRTLLNAGATTEVPETFCGGSLLLYVKTGSGRDNSAIAEMLTRAGAR